MSFFSVGPKLGFSARLRLHFFPTLDGVGRDVYSLRYSCLGNQNFNAPGSAQVRQAAGLVLFGFAFTCTSGVGWLWQRVSVVALDF